MTDIANLGLRVDSSDVRRAKGDLDQFAASADKAERATDGLGQSTKRAGAEAGRSVTSILAMAGRLLPVVAIAGAAVTATLKSLKGASELSLAAQAAGVAAGKLSELAAVARASGGDLNSLSTAFETMQERISQAASGQREATAALTQLGLQVEFLRSLSPEEQFEQIADALQRVQNTSDRVRLGNQVLGGSYEKLVPMLAEGSKGLERMVDAQEKLGNTLSDEEIRKLKAMQDAVKELGQAWTRFGNTLAITVAPALTNVLEMLTLPNRSGQIELMRNQLKSIEQGYDEVAKAALRAGLERIRFGTGEGVRGGGGGGAGRPKLDVAAIAEADKELTEAANAAERLAETLAKTMSAAQFSADMSAISRTAELTSSRIAMAERLLESARRTGLISEREYFAEKRQLLEANAEAQIKALEAERDRISSEPATGAGAIKQATEIAEKEVEITIIRQEALADLKLIADEEYLARSRMTQATEEATRAEEAYLKTLQQQWQRSLDGFGQGTRQREVDAERSRIDDEYAERRQRLEEDRRRGLIGDDQYKDQLSAIERFHGEALASFESYYSDLSEMQEDWTNGLSEAWANYVEESRNVSKQVEDLFTNAFDGMTDAIVDFAMTGKGNFKDLAESIIADLLRIQVKASLVTLLGGIFGGGGGGGMGIVAGEWDWLGSMFGGGRASGGSVNSGHAYLVGEEGPEVIVPGQSGVVVPNHKLGGTSFNIVSNLTVAAGVSRTEFEQALDQRDAQIKGEIFNGMKRGRWDSVN